MSVDQNIRINKTFSVPGVHPCSRCGPHPSESRALCENGGCGCAFIRIVFTDPCLDLFRQEAADRRGTLGCEDLGLLNYRGAQAHCHVLLAGLGHHRLPHVYTCYTHSTCSGTERLPSLAALASSQPFPASLLPSDCKGRSRARSPQFVFHNALPCCLFNQLSHSFEYYLFPVFLVEAFHHRQLVLSCHVNPLHDPARRPRLDC
jgi:hypothetical protein